MKALIDTNVVLDFLCAREDFFDDAKIVFEHCFTDIEGIIAAHTVSNLFYILQNRYNIPLEKCRKKIKNLCTLLDVAEINKELIFNAIDNNSFSDLEDSLQNECAIYSKVDFIVTRNTEDFKYSKTPVVTPKEFIKIVRSK